MKHLNEFKKTQNKNTLNQHNYMVNNIEKDAKSYFTDSKVFDNMENPILYNVLKIMSHVVSRTICLNLYNVITKLLVLYVSEKYPNNNFENKRNKLIEPLKALKEFIIINNSFARKLIKTTLKIYKNDTEKEKMSDVSIQSILDSAIDIIYNNNNIQISRGNDKALFNSNISKIKSYFIEYINIYIPGCKKYVDEYLSSIIVLKSYEEMKEVM